MRRITLLNWIQDWASVYINRIGSCKLKYSSSHKPLDKQIWRLILSNKDICKLSPFPSFHDSQLHSDAKFRVWYLVPNKSSNEVCSASLSEVYIPDTDCYNFYQDSQLTLDDLSSIQSFVLLSMCYKKFCVPFVLALIRHVALFCLKY